MSGILFILFLWWFLSDNEDKDYDPYEECPEFIG